MLKSKVPSPLFVLGMHRSGTSMVMGALNSAGVYAGAITDHNNEALYAVYLNDFFLREAAGSWWELPAVEALEVQLATAQQHLRPEDIYQTHFKIAGGGYWNRLIYGKSHWAIKDPRLCLTLPWWLQRFPEAKVIWVMRNEDDVVESLLRRQEKADEARSELNSERALHLVRSYNERAAMTLRTYGVPFMSVHYEDLVSKDERLQRMTWYGLYQFAGVKPGQCTGFSARGAGETKRAAQQRSKEAPAPNDGPLVSVIIPNYNHAPYLDERIGSVLNQSYRNIEVLLMDDLSPDHSREILQKWAASDPRVSLLFNEKNSGSPFAQWERGAKWAKGKYLWIAESDDFADLDMLSHHVQALEDNDRAVMVYSHSHMVDENSAFLRDFREDYAFIFGDATRWNHNFTTHGPTEVSTTMVFSNTIPNASGALFRKEIFDRVGAPETTWRLNGDWLFYARILQHGDLIFLSKPRNYFRFHTQTQRSRAMANYAAFDEILAMYTIFEQEGWATRKTLHSARAQVATWWAGNVFSMKWNADVFRNNLRLYRTFKPYKKHLLRPVLFNGFIKISGILFDRFGLKQPVKKFAAKLFPKTFFAH